MSQLCRTKLNQLKRCVLDHNPASQFCLLQHKEKRGRWSENLCQDRMKGRNNSGNIRGGGSNGWKKATKTEELSLQTGPKRYWKVLPFWLKWKQETCKICMTRIARGPCLKLLSPPCIVHCLFSSESPELPFHFSTCPATPTQEEHWYCQYVESSRTGTLFGGNI